MADAKKKVEDLEIGDRVDLASCPYLSKHPTAEFEFAVVDGVDRETENCIAISYEGIDTIGYPVGTELTISLPVESPIESQSPRG